MSRAENIYDIADSQPRTLQVCIDRLHELGANQQLEQLADRLQKLATQASPGDGEKASANRGDLQI